MHQGYLRLPHSLLVFFRTKSIRKVGVGIKGDLTRLFNNCGFVAGVDPPFIGGLELGQLAKEKNAVARANIGLADLCSSILHKYLLKDPSIRLSERWNEIPLSDTHANYAALDAHATWMIFLALQAHSHGAVVDHLTPRGTPVYLYSEDHSRPVAWGHIALDRPKQLGGVNITNSRVLVVIRSVLVPGHIVSGELLSTQRNTALSELPPLLYTLLCKAKYVQICSEPDNNLSSSTSNLPLSAEFPEHPLPSSTQAIYAESSTLDGSGPTCDISNQIQWYANALHTYDPAGCPTDSLPRDAEGDIHARKLLEIAESMSSDVLRSCVLGDIWHLMNQFPISVSHSLHAPFACALWDAFFLFDPEDKATVKEFLKSQNHDWDGMLRYHSDWILCRVKRFVPGPEELVARVAKVLYSYGPLLDPKTKQPLFNNRAWEIATNVLENIRRGLYSDPPSVPFYYPRRVDPNSLMQYCCVRGTNAIEGGIHQNVIQWFGSFNASSDFAVELLCDYTLYHNLWVCHDYHC